MKVLLVLLFTLVGCAQVKPKVSPSSTAKKFASLNYEIKGGKSWEDFASQLDFLISKANKLSADYLLLPELITLDLFPVNPKDNEITPTLEKIAEHQPKYEQLLIDLSQKYNQRIIGASSIVKAEGKLLNRAYYVNGSKLSFQDKIYPTPWETKYGLERGSALKFLSVMTIGS